MKLSLYWEANGAGKSTLLRTIGGICRGQFSGTIAMDGQPICGRGSDKIVECGLALVPEGRAIFGDLSVAENLKLGAYAARARDDERRNLQRVMGLFPKLDERRHQIARTMSGGEQQMVAIGRAMMSNPSILLLDEPSLGLSPILCKELFSNLGRIKNAGIGILLVEQNARQSLAIADRGYLLENAHIVHEDSAKNLAGDPAVQKAYLGVASIKADGADKTIPLPVTPAQIAADALESFETPTTRVISPRPIARVNADQLLGSSINEIVRRAADISRNSTDHPVNDSSPVLAGDDNDRLGIVLADITRAAANARTRPHRKLGDRKYHDPKQKYNS